jgi:hypothetical protein
MPNLNNSAAIVLCGLLLMQLGCAGAESSPPPAARATTWHRVATWDGSGIKQTETFETKTREWRVTWATTNEVMAGAGIFQVMVHDAETQALVTLAANKQGVGKDTSTVRTSPGRYYLTINSANLDWTVTVDEAR